jgi:hypothetical protein
MGFLGFTSLKLCFGTSAISPVSTTASPFLPEGTRVSNSTAFFYTACHKYVPIKRMAAKAVVTKKPSANGTFFLTIAINCGCGLFPNEALILKFKMS